MQLLGRDYLKIYLEDHYAGSTAGLELARRAAGANRGTPYGDVLEGIAREIDEDREALRAIMTDARRRARTGSRSRAPGRARRPAG